jgi:hypothetical protein
MDTLCYPNWIGINLTEDDDERGSGRLSVTRIG